MDVPLLIFNQTQIGLGRISLASAPGSIICQLNREDFVSVFFFFCQRRLGGMGGAGSWGVAANVAANLPRRLMSLTITSHATVGAIRVFISKLKSFAAYQSSWRKLSSINFSHWTEENFLWTGVLYKPAINSLVSYILSGAHGRG